MFAKGKHAVARCQRSGDKIPYRDLVEDGYKPGLMVSKEWRDIKHPAERPVRVREGIALHRPGHDNENPTEALPDSIADSLFPGQPVFGGGT